jgi:hypothetical protein
LRARPTYNGFPLPVPISGAIDDTYKHIEGIWMLEWFEEVPDEGRGRPGSVEVMKTRGLMRSGTLDRALCLAVYIAVSEQR